MTCKGMSRRGLIASAFLSGIGGTAGSLPAWSGSAGLGEARSRVLQAYTDSEKPTALAIVEAGRLVVGYGDMQRKVNLASVRKSLLGALYGIAVAEGRIDPVSTLAALGIDDLPPGLDAAEKRATVLDLLKARSGVYHPAAYETADIRNRRPRRGSHAAGEFWFYNNWDFNALGTIFRQQTGTDIFAGFHQMIARPIGMEDFSPRDGRYVREASSIHEAYPFQLSCRDAVRFGELILNRGSWKGRQVVPAQWIADSLTAHSQTDRGDLGYGYLWWVLKPEVFGSGAGFAAGFGGQFIAVVPSRHLVMAQVIARPAQGGGTTRRFVSFLRSIAAAP